MIEFLSNTLQILLGIELIYPDTFISKQERLLVSSIKSISLDQKQLLKSSFHRLKRILNDYYDCKEHCDCVNNLEEFKKNMKLSHILFVRELTMGKDTRFILTGMK